MMRSITLGVCGFAHRRRTGGMHGEGPSIPALASEMLSRFRMTCQSDKCMRDAAHSCGRAHECGWTPVLTCPVDNCWDARVASQAQVEPTKKGSRVHKPRGVLVVLVCCAVMGSRECRALS